MVRRQQTRGILGLLLYVLLGASVVVAGSPEEESNPVLRAFRQATWTKGPGTAAIQGVAELALPEGYGVTAGEDARRISEAMRNPSGGADFALVFGPGDWFMKLTFDEMGYVKDDEKGALDAGSILESIRQGTEEANKERARRGWPAIRIVGWHTPPHYDSQTHNLTWAIQAEVEGKPVINYDTRILGRKGVMQVKLVTAPATLATAIAEYRSLMTGYSFKKGNRYAEWVQGDKMAQVGLTALVTGGAAAVAVKSGALKWLWKVLVAVGIGSLAFLRKLFKRGESA